MNSPSVSILMTSYNPKESYIKRAVDSVLSQTYSDWELIIVDNGSSKSISNILNVNDRRIIIFRLEKNIGRSNGKNEALKKFKGHYITFLDDDDWLHKEKLAKSLHLLQQGYNFVHSDYIYNDENNHSFQGQYQYALQHLKNDPVYHQTCYSNLLILPPVFHSSLIFDKNVSFYNGALDADDWGFFIKLFLLNRDRLKIYFIPEILNYVQSQRNNKNKSRNKLFYEWRKNLLLDLIDISSGLKLKRETDIFSAMIIYDHILQGHILKLLSIPNISTLLYLIKHFNRMVYSRIPLINKNHKNFRNAIHE